MVRTLPKRQSLLAGFPDPRHRAAGRDDEGVRIRQSAPLRMRSSGHRAVETLGPATGSRLAVPALSRPRGAASTTTLAGGWWHVDAHGPSRPGAAHRTVRIHDISFRHAGLPQPKRWISMRCNDTDPFGVQCGCEQLLPMISEQRERSARPIGWCVHHADARSRGPSGGNTPW
jgi:hypothetical protein